MGIATKIDALRGAPGGDDDVRRPEGHEFLNVMQSLERRLEDLRNSGGALSRSTSKLGFDGGARQRNEVHAPSLDEAMEDLQISRAAAKDAVDRLQACSTLNLERERYSHIAGSSPVVGNCERSLSPAIGVGLRSRLRQMRAETFEEKLRRGRGDSSSRSGITDSKAQTPSSAGRLTLLETAAKRRSSDTGINYGVKESSFTPRVNEMATPESERLRRQLGKAECELERLSRSVELMRRDHDSQIAVLRAANGAQERTHAAEKESLKSEAAAALSDVERLQRALAEERKRSTVLLERNTKVQDNHLPSTPQALAPIIASMELEALQRADIETRCRLKKKLQLKWHPDKCINSSLAKCVMQELQQRPEWNCTTEGACSP